MYAQQDLKLRNFRCLLLGGVVRSRSYNAEWLCRAFKHGVNIMGLADDSKKHASEQNIELHDAVLWRKLGISSCVV